jgi:putative FmdB family regulatory protein
LPIYEYKCANGHVFETVQSMSADPVTECEVCGAPVERVYHPVAVHFKGSGFYSTDYGSKKKGSGDSTKEKESSSKSDSSSESSDSGSTKEPAKAKSDSGSSD